MTIRHAAGDRMDKIRCLGRWRGSGIMKYIQDAWLEDPKELRKTGKFKTDHKIQPHIYCKCVNPTLEINSKTNEHTLEARMQSAAQVGVLPKKMADLHGILISDASGYPYAEIPEFNPQ